MPNVDVTLKDISDFESTWLMKVLTVRNLFSSPTFGSQSDVEDVADLLNYISDKLWYRDQVLAGKMPKTPNYT